MYRKTIIALILLLSSIMADIRAFAGVDADRIKLVEIIDRQKKGLAEDAMALWDLAELGFMENESVALLQARLKEAGFSIETGVAEMPTAFVARYSNGTGPVIGILAEYDALPGLSQDRVPYRKEMPEKMRGHGCGHNLFAAASTASAIAIREWLEQSGTRGEIRLYGCPAEEGGAGKVFLVRDGLFNDVDAVLHWHPFDYNGYFSSTLMGMLTAQISFHGKSAHAATHPEHGRSALDGVQLLNIAIEFLREHIPDKSRIHYIVSNGGSTPNVVPDYASTHVTVRHADMDVVKEIWNRITDAAKGAALATGTEVEYEIISGMYPVLVNNTLLEVTQKNFEKSRKRHMDAKQSDFAEKISDSIPRADRPGASDIVPPFPAREVNASTDVGDVSWVVPTVGIYTMCWVPGTSAHSWQAVAASGTSYGIAGAELGAEVLTATAIDLFLDPELLKKAKEEMFNARGKDFVYKPLSPNAKPHLDYQKSFSGK